MLSLPLPLLLLLLGLLLALVGGPGSADGSALVALAAVGRRPPRREARARPPGARPRAPASPASRRERRLEALGAVAATVARGTDLAPAAREILEAVGTATGASAGGIVRTEGDGGLLPVACFGPEGQIDAKLRELGVPSGPLAAAARGGRVPMVAATTARESDVRPGRPARRRARRTHVSLPITARGRTWGVLFLEGPTIGGLGSEESAFLQAVAGQLGLAAEMSALRGEARESNRRAELLTRLGREVAERPEPAGVLGALVATTRELVPDAGVRLWLADGDDLVLEVEAGIQAGGAPRPGRLQSGEGPEQRAARRREPVQVEDLVDDPRTAASDGLRAQGFVSAACVPLLAGERVIGVLSVLARARGALDADALGFLALLGGQAALAVANAQLQREAAAGARQARVVADLGRALTSTLDAGRILDLVTPLAREALGVARVGICLRDPHSGLLRFVRGEGFDDAFLRDQALASGEGVAGRATAEGRPVWTSDILADPEIPLRPDSRRRIEEKGTAAVLAVPLVRGEPFGALVVSREAGHRFHGREVEYAAVLASGVAAALENARLFALEATRRGQAEALAAIEAEMASELRLDRLLRLIVERSSAFLGAAGGIFLLEDGALTLRAQAAGDLSPDVRVAVGEGVMGRAAAERAAFLVNDYAGASGALPAIVQRGLRRLMGQPLLVRDRLLGYITMRRMADDAPAFTSQDSDALRAFGARAAIAIENARLFAAADDRAARLRALSRLGQVVSSSLDLDEVLGGVARAAAQLMDVPFVALWLADEGSRTLTVRATSDPDLRKGFPSAGVRFGDGGVGWVAAHRAALIVDDAPGDERMLGGEWWRRHRLQSFLGLPILVGDALVGVLTLCARRPLRLGPDDRDLLDIFVAQAAVAVRNARLHAETQRRLTETQALLAVVEILNSTLEPRRLLQQAAIKIAQACGVDRCTVERWDGDRVVPLMAQFGDGRQAGHLWRAFLGMAPVAPAAVPARARAIETRRPVVVDDALASELVPREWVDSFGLRSILIVPLIRQDRVIGGMGLDCSDRPRSFQPWQVDLAVAIAGQLALALDNSRLYGELQESLREARALLAVAHALSRPEARGDAMRQVAREIARSLGADLAAVYALDARGEALAPVAGYHVPKDLVDWFRDHPLLVAHFPLLHGDWRLGRAAASGHPGADPRFDSEWVRRLPPHSVLFVPLRVRGEPVGGLFLVWWQPGRRFAPAEERLAEAVAGQVGLALENLELDRQMRVRLHDTETLLAVSRTLSGGLDLAAIARQFSRHVAGAIGADAAGVWLFEPDGDRLRALAGYRVPPAYLAALRALRTRMSTSSFYAEAARTRRCAVSSDAPNDPRVPAEVLAAAPHRTQVFVPIVAKDTVIGGFAVVWWQEARTFSEDELRLLEAVGSQAGMALDNARLFTDHERRLEELSVLHELSRAVTGQLDQAGLLDALQEQIARVLEVANMVVLLYDREREELEVALRIRDGRRDMHEPLRLPAEGTGLASVVLRTRGPLRTDDYAAECRRLGVAPLPEVVGLRHWMGVPMAVGDQVLGVLALRSASRPFRAADERLLANIAHLSALALRSARLFEDRTRAYAELATAQDQLVRSEKLRALGEMASGVAHDFNNVLAAIVGRAQLLLRHLSDPKLRRWAEVIERSGMDGARTVRRLQEFTRIRRDQPFVAVDLNVVVHQALEATEGRWREEPRARGIEVRLVTRLDPTLPSVAGDPAELREALTNLVLNAVDAMPGGGTLTVATASEGDRVDLTVGDTGVGIPEHVRPRIFDPFFTTKGSSGTGLGLSMTYGIVSRHGARVAVESEEGRGTTFRLSFPAGEAERVFAHAVEAPAPRPPLRCLVVDDEEAVGEAIGDMLVSVGHRVVMMTDGAQAVERFRGEPFDVVLTDLAMPGLTGWDVARAVKGLRPDVPVFMASGFGVEVSAETLHAHGVSAVLSKPIRIRDILDVLADVTVRPD